MDSLTQEEVDSLLSVCRDVEPRLKHCVSLNGGVYCYDATNKECVEVVLTPKTDSDVPEEAEKLIAMKRFNLKELQQKEA